MTEMVPYKNSKGPKCKVKRTDARTITNPGIANMEVIIPLIIFDRKPECL